MSTVGMAVLRSAWVEIDTMVQSTMWHPMLKFLKREELLYSNLIQPNSHSRIP